jgi:ceramide glucosyltransferase
VLVTVILSALALLSLGLLLWQCVAALRFPLHRHRTDVSFALPITILKPLKGCDEHTAACLRSWLAQKHDGAVQVLFGVAEQTDLVCDVVRELLQQFPKVDAELVITPEPLGTNAKIATVTQLMSRAKHPVLCLSDADVRVPEIFLSSAAGLLRDPGVGLVNCFYQLANPTTLAMRWEAVAINADFWSQVLQSNTIKRQDFALGAAMLLRADTLAKIGGFESLLDYLADDYQLGHRVAATGARIELSPVVVECWDKPRDFTAVWNHQLRWARTIRACQPVPYFFSILNNVTLWAVLLAVFGEGGRFLPGSVVPLGFFAACLALSARCFIAAWLHMRLTQRRDVLGYWWLAPVKDLLQAGIWAASFLGNTVEWRGRQFALSRDGKLMPR